MIEHIKGKLIKKKPGLAVVETAGIAYNIIMPLNSYNALPSLEAEITVLTKVIIREDTWDIFGFLSTVEREIFLALTTVNRVGPRLAFTIISSIEPLELTKALISKDLAILSSIKGIGKKTAERLLLELKDKAPKLASLAGVSKNYFKEVKIDYNFEDDIEDNDAASALMNLGYSAKEALGAVKKAEQEIGPEGDIAQLIKTALKVLTKK